MLNKIKTIFLACILTVGVNATPVQIINDAGAPIVGEQLLDSQDLPAGGIFYLNPGAGAILNVGAGGARPEARLFFRVTNATYVEINLLENRAVRNKLLAIAVPQQAFRPVIEVLRLCVRLHIEEWENDIPASRAAGLLVNRNEIIRRSFDYLHDNSNPEGRRLIRTVGNAIINSGINEAEIVNRYMTLRISFHRERANGNAKKALKYLLQISALPNAYIEEIVLIDAFVNKFTTHIAKHFCHHTVMNRPQNEFVAAGIAEPQDGAYTSLSYNDFPQTLQQALQNARTVYASAINNLLGDYGLIFDINVRAPRFTIRLIENPKRQRPLRNVGPLINMASYNSINATKRIFNNNGMNPEIWRIRRPEDAVAEQLQNGQLCVFFNLGVNFNVDEQFLIGAIDGSLFPVVN